MIIDTPFVIIDTSFLCALVCTIGTCIPESCTMVSTTVPRD